MPLLALLHDHQHHHGNEHDINDYLDSGDDNVYVHIDDDDDTTGDYDNHSPDIDIDKFAYVFVRRVDIDNLCTAVDNFARDDRTLFYAARNLTVNYRTDDDVGDINHCTRCRNHIRGDLDDLAAQLDTALGYIYRARGTLVARDGS